MNLLDSSILIELIKNTKTGKKIASSIADEIVVTSSFSAHEVLAGRSPKDELIISHLISGLKVLSYDLGCAKISANIQRKLKESGEMVGRTDIYIAAIALKHDLELVTLDHDFSKIPDLKVKIFEYKES